MLLAAVAMPGRGSTESLPAPPEPAGAAPPADGGTEVQRHCALAGAASKPRRSLTDLMAELQKFLFVPADAGGADASDAWPPTDGEVAASTAGADLSRRGSTSSVVTPAVAAEQLLRRQSTQKSAHEDSEAATPLAALRRQVFQHLGGGLR